MSSWSEKRGYALAARIMTSSRKTRGEDIDAASGYSWHFGRGVAMKPARNKWLHPTATAASAPFASGEPSRYECPVLLAQLPFAGHPCRSNEIHELDRALYAAENSPWNGQALWAIFIQGLHDGKTKDTSSTVDTLSPLYPRWGWKIHRYRPNAPVIHGL